MAQGRKPQPHRECPRTRRRRVAVPRPREGHVEGGMVHEPQRRREADQEPEQSEACPCKGEAKGRPRMGEAGGRAVRIGRPETKGDGQDDAPGGQRRPAREVGGGDRPRVEAQGEGPGTRVRKRCVQAARAARRTRSVNEKSWTTGSESRAKTNHWKSATPTRTACSTARRAASLRDRGPPRRRWRSRRRAWAAPPPSSCRASPPCPAAPFRRPPATSGTGPRRRHGAPARPRPPAG